jgi:hypothetical protein
MKKILFIATLLPGFCMAADGFSLFSPAYQLVYFPKVDEVAEVEPGRSMITTALKADLPAIELASAIEHSGAKHFTTYRLVIPKDTLVLYAQDSRGRYYRATKTLFIHWNGVLGGDYPVTAGVFVPDNAAQPTEVFYGGADAVPTASETHSNIEFKPTNIETFAKESFKRELIYQGVSQNTVSVSYREFSGDFARPAFTQELKYDLAEGNVIAYKGAKFEVVKAGNAGIKYKVIKTLE